METIQKNLFFASNAKYTVVAVTGVRTRFGLFDLSVLVILELVLNRLICHRTVF